MKKRLFSPFSSELRMVWLAILGVSTAVSACLAAAGVLLMSPQHVGYLRITAPNIAEHRFTNFPNERFASRNSPMFFFGPDLVVFGRSKDVIAPIERNLIAVMQKRSWQEEIFTKVNNSENLRSIFPAKELVLIFSEKNKEAIDLKFVAEIQLLISKINKMIDGKKTVPLLVISSASNL